MPVRVRPPAPISFIMYYQILNHGTVGTFVADFVANAVADEPAWQIRAVELTQIQESLICGRITIDPATAAILSLVQSTRVEGFAYENIQMGGNGGIGVNYTGASCGF